MMSLAFKKTLIAFSGLFLIVALAGCSPDVGSKDWCMDMKETPKGEWSSNHAAAYAKHCMMF